MTRVPEAEEAAEAATAAGAAGVPELVGAVLREQVRAAFGGGGGAASYPQRCPPTQASFPVRAGTSRARRRAGFGTSQRGSRPPTPG